MIWQKLQTQANFLKEPHLAFSYNHNSDDKYCSMEIEESVASWMIERSSFRESHRPEHSFS